MNFKEWLLIEDAPPHVQKFLSIYHGGREMGWEEKDIQDRLTMLGYPTTILRDWKNMADYDQRWLADYLDRHMGLKEWLDGSIRPTRSSQVTAYLKSKGVKDINLVHGEGYWYFSGGDAYSWPSSSVYTYRLTDLTLDEWYKEYLHLSGRSIREDGDLNASGADFRAPEDPAFRRQTISLKVPQSKKANRKFKRQ